VQNKNKVLEILQDSMSGKLGFENQELTGFSGRKLIGLLQGFAKNLSPEESYLEVGVFQGLTLLSVAMVIPETSNNRILFENDHILHASKYPESLPDAASIMNVVKPLQPLRLFNRLFRLRKSLSSKPLAFHGNNSRMNTFSNGLPFEKINPSLMES